MVSGGAGGIVVGIAFDTTGIVEVGTGGAGGLVVKVGNDGFILGGDRDLGRGCTLGSG